MKKIILTGGPSSGKTTLINAIKAKGLLCLPEISREIINKAKADGIDQLFLNDPYLFSNLLLEGRVRQYQEAADAKENVFIDRGLPDVEAYLHFKNLDIPDNFSELNNKYLYDLVFILPTWQAIFETDEQRYESFKEAKAIDFHLRQTYKKYGYEAIEVPKTTVENRLEFVLKQASL